MADLQKFLDQAGVSTLWNQVVAKIEEKVNAVPAYDDTEVRNLIASEVSRAKLAEQANADDIAALEALVGEETVANQIAAKIAEVVAGADTSFDTLKEIAAWINTHASDATAMNKSISDNADAITALQNLVGSKTVALQISEAIAAAGHATAADLSTAVARIATLEEWKASHATEFTNLKNKVDTLQSSYDEITATGGQPNIIETIQVNGVAQTVTSKTVNIEVPVIEALTAAEIQAACK